MLIELSQAELTNRRPKLTEALKFIKLSTALFFFNFGASFKKHQPRSLLPCGWIQLVSP